MTKAEFTLMMARLNAHQEFFKGYMSDLNSSYQVLTNAWGMFSLCGDSTKLIQKTYDRLTEKGVLDYKQFTELVLVLNHKIWEWHEKNEAVGKYYNDLWLKAENLFNERFPSQEAQSYYFEITD